jgi:hypothetical protein
MNPHELIEKYHNAWTAGDFATARACLADDLDFEGSIDSFRSADEFVASLRRFHGMLRRVALLHSLFGPDTGALLYDCDTASPAGTIRTAEFFTVRDDRIHAIRLVFDASELRKLMQR